MPIFVYLCASCEHKSEHLSLSKADVLKNCPVCNSERVSKTLTTAAVQLKGGGWAKDGYGSVAHEPDRGSKEKRLRSEVQERAYDQQGANDRKAAEHGLVRSAGPLQKVNFYPERPIE